MGTLRLARPRTRPPSRSKTSCTGLPLSSSPHQVPRPLGPLVLMVPTISRRRLTVNRSRERIAPMHAASCLMHAPEYACIMEHPTNPHGWTESINFRLGIRTKTRRIPFLIHLFPNNWIQSLEIPSLGHQSISAGRGGWWSLLPASAFWASDAIGSSPAESSPSCAQLVTRTTA